MLQLNARPCSCLSDVVKNRRSERARSCRLAIIRYLSVPPCQPLNSHLCFHSPGALGPRGTPSARTREKFFPSTPSTAVHWMTGWNAFLHAHCRCWNKKKKKKERINGLRLEWRCEINSGGVQLDIWDVFYKKKKKGESVLDKIR